MQVFQVLHADAQQTLGRGALAIGVRAVHRLGKAVLHHRSGFGQRFADGGADAFTVAQPHGFGKSRMRHLPRRQRHGFVQQVGVVQTAQAKAHAVSTCAGPKAGAQVGPGLTDLVFVHGLRVRALALGFCAGAVGHLPGHDRGQTRLCCRISAASCIDVDLHIDHGNGVALDQVHARTVGLCPVLDGQRSVRPAGRSPTGQRQRRTPPSQGRHGQRRDQGHVA